MSDVNDDTLAEMDALVAEGVPGLQALHRLPGRLLQRRRVDLPGDAADREERRADHDARRERDGHRRRRRPDVRGRHDRSRSATAWPARRSSRARRPTGSSASPRRPASPSTSSTCPSREALAEVRAARDRGSMAFAETCPQYLFLSLDDMGNGFEGAKFVCSPPLRPKDHWDDLWTGLVKDDLQLVATDHCPFDFHGQKELGRGDFRKVPNGLPGVEDRVDLLHDGGVVGGRISRERWVEIISTAPAKMFGMYPKKGAIAVGSDADIVIYDPNRRAHDLGEDAPHGRRLLVLRGPRPSRAAATSSCPAARSSSGTASSPGARDTAGSSGERRPTTPACREAVTGDPPAGGRGHDPRWRPRDRARDARVRPVRSALVGSPPADRPRGHRGRPPRLLPRRRPGRHHGELPGVDRGVRDDRHRPHHRPRPDPTERLARSIAARDRFLAESGADDSPPGRGIRRPIWCDAGRRFGVPRRLRPGTRRPGRLPSAQDRGPGRGGRRSCSRSRRSPRCARPRCWCACSMTSQSRPGSPTRAAMTRPRRPANPSPTPWRSGHIPGSSRSV